MRRRRLYFETFTERALGREWHAMLAEILSEQVFMMKEQRLVKQKKSYLNENMQHCQFLASSKSF